MRIPIYPTRIKDLFFPRAIDLMTLLSFQQSPTIDPNRELNQFFGTASVPIGKVIKRPIPTKDHNLSLTQNARNIQKTDVRYDCGSSKDTIKQKDLWDEVWNELGGELPEVNIQSRTSILPISSKLAKIKSLDGLDYLYQYEVSIANFARTIRERIGYRTSNIFQLIKHDLLLKGLWKPEYRWMRSTLKTKGILGFSNSHTKGWMELFKLPKKRIENNMKTRFPPASLEISKALVENKWWEDVLLPMRVRGRTNGSLIDATFGILDQRGKAVII